MNQNNPFAKLGALEQKLYQETSSQQVDIKSQISGIPENQNTTKREFYTKVTYRICDEAVDALEDAKKHLKRQYKLKVNMEEVVETAIIEIYRDLIEKGEKSVLVTKYSGNPKPEYLKPSIPELQIYRSPDYQNSGNLALDNNLIEVIIYL